MHLTLNSCVSDLPKISSSRPGRDCAFSLICLTRHAMPIATDEPEVALKSHLSPDNCVADLFIWSSSRLRRDCAFASACALPSNAIRDFETTSLQFNLSTGFSVKYLFLPKSCRNKMIFLIIISSLL